ncbi:MAG: flagellar basal-body rod modification protein FlgD [Pirellulaceae bacterium]|jgi:flagellar basal-body rod modification protein FlgD
MSRIDASLPIQQTNQRGPNDLRDLELDNFLDLMIAELQNQDPLDPMDNNEILQQINTIREISATNELSDTLAAVLTGQNLSTASSLIGKSVDALTDAGENIKGVVDRVTVEVSEEDENIRELRVHVGDNSVKLNNVREINEPLA